MGFLDRLCSDDSPDIDAFLFKQCWYFLQLGCVYPNMHTRLWKVLSVLQFTIYIIMLCYGIITFLITVVISKEDMVTIFQAIHYCCMLIAILCALVTENFRRRDLSKICSHHIDGLSNYDFDTELSRQSLDLRKNRKKKWLYVMFLISFTVTGISVIFIGPYIDRIAGHVMDSSNGVLTKLPMRVWSPIGEDTFIGFFLNLLFQISLSVIMIFTVFGNLTFYFELTQLVVTEVDVLLISLERLDFRISTIAGDFNSTDQFDSQLVGTPPTDLSDHCKECLIQNIKHHQNIKQIFGFFSTSVNVIMLVDSLIISVAIAISGFLVYFGNTGYGVKLIAVAFLIGEELLVFFVAWCSEQIIQRNVQKPLELNALGILPISFTTLTSIMEMAYKYFNLLLAVNGK